MAKTKSKPQATTKTREEISRNMGRLRKLIQTSKDPAEVRIAQGMEAALQWVTEETVGWPAPATEARAIAAMLRSEMKFA